MIRSPPPERFGRAEPFHQPAAPVRLSASRASCARRRPRVARPSRSRPRSDTRRRRRTSAGDAEAAERRAAGLARCATPSSLPSGQQHRARARPRRRARRARTRARASASAARARPWRRRAGANSGQASSAATSVMLTITPRSPIAAARGLRAEEAAGERRAERVGEERRVDLHRVAGHEPARGGVHEDVEAAERRRRLPRRRAARACAVGQVGGDRVAAGAGRGERRGGRLGVARRAVVGERDLRAALGQPERDARGRGGGRLPSRARGRPRCPRAQPSSSVEPEAADDRLDAPARGRARSAPRPPRRCARGGTAPRRRGRAA